MQDEEFGGDQQNHSQNPGMMGNPNSNFRRYVDSLSNKEHTFLVRCKVDMYTMGSDNDANRVRYYLSRMLPADIKTYNAVLLDRLKIYKNL